MTRETARAYAGVCKLVNFYIQELSTGVGHLKSDLLVYADGGPAPDLKVRWAEIDDVLDYTLKLLRADLRSVLAAIEGGA